MSWSQDRGIRLPKGVSLVSARGECPKAHPRPAGEGLPGNAMGRNKTHHPGFTILETGSLRPRPEECPLAVLEAWCIGTALVLLTPLVWVWREDGIPSVQGCWSRGTDFPAVA